MNRYWKERWAHWARYTRYRARIEMQARAAMREWLMV
jgi:hypothetical protein